jgi:4-diphosphocytidyl-2-C-methyl-D-erythritol kinase
MAGSRAPRRVRAEAFAKINLSLRVLGRRPDGYHGLRTTFQTLALHDTLTLTTADGAFDLTCTDPRCPVDSTNLVWRAAEAIWRAARRRGTPTNVRVRLHKRVPMQAGLGGGSSDAAAALRAFQALWQVKIGGDRLRRLAATLGADVPFFLEGGRAIGIDRGDVVEARPDVPPSWIVLVIPDFGVSTKDAFAWWDADAFARRRRSTSADAPTHAEFQNDLQAVVGRRHPAIEDIARSLTAFGATLASMSGSGSAVFGCFASRRAASSAAAQLRSAWSRVFLTRTIGRTEFRRCSRPRRA